MHCPTCGTENVGSAAFCRPCGEAIESRQRQGRRLGLAALLLAAAALVAAVVVTGTIIATGDVPPDFVLHGMFAVAVVPATIVLTISVLRHGLGGSTVPARWNTAAMLMLFAAAAGLP